ncbi:PE-PPE domain-containing protein [Mycobacterium asiaticum]|uniref:PE family protein n=1 Tax=Mycobacterium asiaticum TaxID=1790 RepID=A0A1A3N198_MYCAS|nr:PE-PPE domain-containing protein [Mycobacterium asiaticum]OBK14157.1 PE family protein [Mycobacterium asiaticum]
MSYVTTQPQLMTAAAENLAGIQASLAEVNAAVAGQTTGLAAAAADEVSAAAAQLFGAFGQEYQQVVGQAAVFHQEFNRVLAAASAAYADAEFLNAAAVGGALAAASPIEALLAPVLAPLQPLLAPIQSLFAPLQSLFAPPAGVMSGGTPVTTPLPLQGLYDVALIMTGSGTPIPSLDYMASVRPWIRFGVTDPLSIPLNTPEGLYPLTQIKDLPLTQSVQLGTQMLHNAIFSPTGLLAQGQSVSVLGYSQSAILSSMELRNLIAASSPAKDLLSFTLLGNPMAPNGGLLSRFPGLSMPALGLDFFGPTPANSGYPVNMFSLQYDGYTDFPRYPINFLADLNAFLGIQTVHGDYPSIIGSSGQLAPGYKMVELPVSPATQALGLDHYYMISYDGLPLVQPLRSIPVFGNAIADLVEPNLTYLVNWGYGDPHYGYSTSYADVHTPFGLIPPMPENFIGDQIALANQGFSAFAGDINAMVPTSLPSLTDLLPSGGGGGGGGGGLPFALPPTTGFSVNDVFDAIKAANTNVTTAITSAAADGYALLLPTADIANTIVTTLPSYNFNLFLDGLQQAANGDPMGFVNAFGNPFAADVALLTLAGGFQTIVTIDTISNVIGDLAGAAG